SMTIQGQTFQITQNGACTYTLNPSSNLTVPQAGGNYSVNVVTQTGCTWIATESLSWVTITSGASNTGSGTVSYTVQSNSGSPRSGSINVEGLVFQISQNGACTSVLNPSNNLSVPVNGGN